MKSESDIDSIDILIANYNSGSSQKQEPDKFIQSLSSSLFDEKSINESIQKGFNIIEKPFLSDDSEEEKIENNDAFCYIGKILKNSKGYNTKQSMPSGLPLQYFSDIKPLLDLPYTSTETLGKIVYVCLNTEENLNDFIKFFQDFFLGKKKFPKFCFKQLAREALEETKINMGVWPHTNAVKYMEAIIRIGK